MVQNAFDEEVKLVSAKIVSFQTNIIRIAIIVKLINQKFHMSKLSISINKLDIYNKWFHFIYLTINQLP